MRKPLVRACLWGGGALVIALASAAVLEWTLSHRALTKAAPGGLVDVEGHQVHLACEGVGGPTVILEAGAPGISLTWASIAPEIAKFARVCAYDRAGYGWSETASSPRTSDNIVRELRLLLRNAGIEPPYVLVGHSFGGLVVQLYAARFPDEVAGMVLVDSSHPDQGLRTEEVDSLNTLGLGLRLLAPVGIPRLLMPPIPAGSPESRDSSVRMMEEELLRTTRSMRALGSELTGLRESLSEVAANFPDLGHKPLTVLTQGRQGQRPLEFWHEMQEKLTKISVSSEWQVAENAGHFIHQDQPELVVDAIRRVVDSVRSGTW